MALYVTHVGGFEQKYSFFPDKITPPQMNSKSVCSILNTMCVKVVPLGEVTGFCTQGPESAVLEVGC